MMPLVCTVLVLILYLCAHVHNRAYLLARAWEEVIMETRLEEPVLFGAGSINCNQSFGDKENTVTYTADTKAAWGGWDWPVSVGATSKKIKPVDFIRNCQIGKLALEGIKGAGT